MCDVMMFPDTAEEFMEQYKIVDTEQVYTNGAELIPIFRMKQWLEHLQDIKPKRKRGKWLPDTRAFEMMFVCSECKASLHVNTINLKPSWDYCPNCGTYMGEDEE